MKNIKIEAAENGAMRTVETGRCGVMNGAAENSEHGAQGMAEGASGMAEGASGMADGASGITGGVQGITAPAVILVKPQLAENIGMAARAMKNCGLKEMRLVAPEQSPVSETALRASSNSEDILLNARVYATTREALADLDTVYAATARPRHQVKEVFTAEYAATHLPTGRRTGFMFGCERTGLENEDISLADAIIEVPLNPEHCSLNLAQAVLIIGYEYYKTTIAPEGRRFITNGGEVASKEKLFKFLDALTGRIRQSPRLKDEEHTRSLLINVSNIFTRANITEQELNSLYGIVNILSDGKKDGK